MIDMNSTLVSTDMNRSLPTLRRASFSTESSSTESFEDKVLITQKSFPNLKLRNKRSNISEDSLSKYANEKKNQDFHILFRSIPDKERLIEDYGCALQREILLQGRVYISQNHICFNANIFGWITNLVISFTDIEAIEKRSTAIFIPNAILISTATSKHFFASFLSRDQAYDQIIDLWKAARSNDFDDNNDSSSIHSLDDSDFISSTNSPVPIHSVSIPDPRLEYIQKNTTTECDCSKNDLHFPTIVLDTIYTTNIQTIYHLLYNSNFMRHFLLEVEKSTDVSIGQWSKSDESTDSRRESSYTKYLGGSIGPKSTKCYLKEEMIHLDLENYVSQLTVTQTPDVPSGGSFTVKTRTCLSYVGHGQVRMLVTVLVDFTKSSWLKSTIEKASIDGQQNFYKSLDSTITNYLNQQTTLAEPVNDKTSQKSRKKLPRACVKQEKETKINEKTDLLKTLNPSHILVAVMVMMVIINVYMATKMARVDKRLNQFHINQSNSHYTEEDWLVTSKDTLDLQMIELEKMVKRASRDIEQITSQVKIQREKIYV